MNLYKIRNGIIEVEKVAKEARCGWRKLNGGFYNRNPMTSFIHLEETYLTTDVNEAISWAKDIRNYLNHLTQVSMASISDIDFWIDGGSVEDEKPKSRMIHLRERLRKAPN